VTEERFEEKNKEANAGVAKVQKKNRQYPFVCKKGRAPQKKGVLVRAQYNST